MRDGQTLSLLEQILINFNHQQHYENNGHDAKNKHKQAELVALLQMLLLLYRQHWLSGLHRLFTLGDIDKLYGIEQVLVILIDEGGVFGKLY